VLAVVVGARQLGQSTTSRPDASRPREPTARDVGHSFVEHRSQFGHIHEPFECRLTAQFPDCTSACAHDDDSWP
jgi:hypothetical protein